MDRRIALILLAVLAGTGAWAETGLPKRADIGYAVSGRYERALTAIPKNSADEAERYFRALSLIETGQAVSGFQGMEELCRGAEVFGPAGCEFLAEYFFSMGRYEKLVQSVVREPKGRLSDPDGYNYRLGQSLFLSKKNPEAKAVLEKVGGQRWKVYALYTLGQMAFGEGDYGSAIEYFTKSIDAAQQHQELSLRQPLLDLARLTRSRVFYQAAVTGTDMNEERKTKLLKLAVSQMSLIKPESGFYAGALRSIGWCSLEMNDSVRALASFETAETLDPENAHEDIWARGRVLERLGFMEEALDAYREAGDAARKRAESLSAAQVPEADSASSVDLIRISSRLHKLALSAEKLSEALAVAKRAAADRSQRLTAIRAELYKVNDRLEALSAELSAMDKQLYRYLDSMPAAALIPKKERGRVEAIADAREKVLREIEKTQSGIVSLEETRSWQASSEEKKEEVRALWKRLEDKALEMASLERGFLETVKTRVSLRERELAEILNEKRDEAKSLGDLYVSRLEVLKGEESAIKELSAKIKELDNRGAAIEVAIGTLNDELLHSIRAREKLKVEESAQAVRARADRYALDEAQALHLLKTRGGVDR